MARQLARRALPCAEQEAIAGFAERRMTKFDASTARCQAAVIVAGVALHSVAAWSNRLRLELTQWLLFLAAAAAFRSHFKPPSSEHAQPVHSLRSTDLVRTRIHSGQGQRRCHSQRSVHGGLSAHSTADNSQAAPCEWSVLVAALLRSSRVDRQAHTYGTRGAFAAYGQYVLLCGTR